MTTIISGLLSFLARNLLPAAWIKSTITALINSVLNRFFQYADRLAANTMIDIDNKAVAILKEKLLAPGVVADFVDYVYSFLFGTLLPVPVDPINPPSPLPPEPVRPGILKRLGGWVRKKLANNW